MADLNQFLEQIQEFDINDIDWDRIGVWPLGARVAITVVACVAIVCGGYFLFIKDKNIQLDVETQKETQLRKSFETKAHEAASLDKYRQQMMEMEASFGALVSRLPSDTEVPGLIEDIDDKGVESRLTIDGIDLLDEVSTEFHIELPINIMVSGGYHEFGAFISGIAGMPRIVTLHDFKVSETTDKDKPSGQLKMEIMAKTYRYKSQER